MPLHTRQHSIPFAPADKNQAISSANNSSMLCPYSSSPMYSNVSNSHSGNWPLNHRESYNGVDMGQDQRTRWQQPQQESSLRRERRLECSNVPSLQNSMHAHHGSHVENNTPLYSNPSQLPRSSGYNGMYTRPMSTDMQSSAPSWNGSWDMDANSAPSAPTQYQRFNEEHSPWNNSINLEIPQFESSDYDNLMLSSSESSSTSSTLYTTASDTAIPLNGFSFPHRLSPDAPSPSPSPVYHQRHHPKQTSSSSGSPLVGVRRSSEDRPETGKSCSHCRATTTPLWRRDPSTLKPLCNACGLYLQQRNKLRPQELIDADDDGSSSEESDPNYVGPECSHCHTHHTSVWRRSKAGDQLCNACGVYARLRGKPRPLTLKKHKIRPRSKHSPK